MPEDRRFGGLLRYRRCLLPTFRGCLVLLLICAIVIVGVGRRLHSFLAVTDPLPGGAMVVEGWATDYAFEEAISEFNRNHYEKLYVTGGPIDSGAPLSEYKTYAQRGAAVALKLGLSTNVVQEVPAARVRQDRTFAAAMALRAWSLQHGVILTKVHLITEGPHARRSRLLFQKALGKQAEIGVTAVPVRDYDPEHWWRSSAGVRGVIGELIGYGYARIVFSAPKD